MMDKRTILIIEDDESIRDGIRLLLESEGYSVKEAETGEQGLIMLDNDTSLIILDVMLPGISGYKVCEEIRKISVVPILFLTAKSTDNDKVLGLSAGGDDYLIKPFSYVELVARIKALLRRHTEYNTSSSIHNDSDEWLEHNGIRISLSKNVAYLDGKEVTLTETEYQILLLFIKNPEAVFSVPELYEAAWKQAYHSDSANTVMVHIRKLRTKIEKDPQHPQIILNVWGRGYRIG